jgi:undecaprenyl pyrophosphate phosphatase UppP
MNAIAIVSVIIVVVLGYIMPMIQMRQGSGSDEEKKRIRFRSGLAILIAFIPIGFIDLAGRQINGMVNLQSLTSVLLKYTILWLACIFILIPYASKRGSLKK